MQNKYYLNKTAIIAGGSKGIGKALAAELLKQGGSVLLIARNNKTLQRTANELKSHITNTDQYIDTLDCDTTDHKKLKQKIDTFIKKRGVPEFLINCVGYAYSNYLPRCTIQDFRDNMETNYFGQLTPVLLLLPYFIKNGKGHIINCSSIAGYIGTMGYATYTPTKFAVAGLTESLRHELKPYNIHCSIMYPPDTNTPGFDTENISKPEEVKIFSEGGGLVEPDKVAKTVLRGIRKKKFYIHIGQSNLIWRIMRFSPRLMHFILDRELQKAVKKIKRNKNRKGTV